MIGRYRWRGGDEHYLRLGETAAVTLLVLPALFEEANRMRRFTVSLMQMLAVRGVGTILPDLPGTGESVLEISDVSTADWDDAIKSAAYMIDKPLRTLAIRGGALFDAVADSGWRLAPESGERLLRDMVRATALSLEISASQLDQRARTQGARLAGNRMSPSLYVSIGAATPTQGRYRTARLEGDAGECDVTFSGARLWRAAEPGEDRGLAAACAEDIASWIETCDG